MVDIAIGAPQPPILRIGPEIGTHVGIYKGLQIDAQRVAEGTDHDIGAHTFCALDVTVRETEDAVGRVITQRHTDLAPRRADKALRVGERHCLARHTESKHRAQKGAPRRPKREDGLLHQIRFAQKKTTGSACWRNRSFLKAVSALGERSSP